MRVFGVPTYHDPVQGSARGKNTVTVVEAEDLRVAHLGDLGHVLVPEQTRAIGALDVVMIPVGGHFTIGPTEADQVIAQLRPRVVIPMHYKTEFNASWPIGTLDDFLRGKAGVRRVGTAVTVTRDSLPPEQEIWVLG